MKRLRVGAMLHFIIAIGHLGCLFALDEAFDAYGIKDVMHNMVFGHVWMLYALTICLALAFTLAGLYALSATGDIRRLPLTRTAIIVIIVLYNLRALAGGWACVQDFLHTKANKLTGFLLFVGLMAIGQSYFVPVAWMIACIALFAAIQEGYIIRSK